MIRNLVLLISLSICSNLSVANELVVKLSNNTSSVTIQGYAPSYCGKTLEIISIEDYISMKEKTLARSTVLEDSTFSITFPCSKTQKIFVKGMNNKGFIYVQPGSNYNIVFPDRNKYDPYRPAGNQVEITFLDLDSLDINYKILGFQRWVDDFGANHFYYRQRDPVTFGKNLDLFKTNVERVYAGDSLSMNSDFFRTFVKYSIAGLDNVQFAAERNQYEKYDFYIKYMPVAYDNDAYMEYINGFYQQLMHRLTNKTNQEVYVGVLKSSPSHVMNALSKEYTASNLRIREIIMLKSLSEVYNSGTYPQTNILTILDSLATKSIFVENQLIAKNLKSRLTELTPGSKAPDFVLAEQGKSTKTLYSYKNKYVYLHFLDPSSIEGVKEMQILEGIHDRYNDYVEFITVYRRDKELNEMTIKTLDEIKWDHFSLAEGNAIWKNYQIETFPHYTLIDVTGNIVANPALSPVPDGEYETIDKVFFQIKSVIDQNKN